MNKDHEGGTLVIPAGVRIDVGENGFRISNPGDIVIHGALDHPLDVIASSDGSVTLDAADPVTLNRIEAPRGEVKLAGELSVRTVYARRVSMVSGKLSAGSIVAEERIELEGEVLQADILATPSVEISDDLKGRATVIECVEEPGPHRLKGGFRLEEYLDLFPAGDEILAKYPDVNAYLDQASSDEAETTDADSSLESIEEVEELEPSSLETADQGDREGEVLTLTDPVHTAPGRPLPESTKEAQSGDDDLYQYLSETYLKVIGCYTGVSLPPQLRTIERLIESRDFVTLKKRITSLWNELIQYHKREGINLGNTVTHNIQKMKQLLQDQV